MSLLLRDVEVRGHRTDVRVDGGAVTAMDAGLPHRSADVVLDGHGGALLPGLCDHHLHLHALAAVRQSVPCGPPAVPDRAALGAALRAAPPDRHGWVRGVGYTESVAGDLDAATLDGLHDSRPVRVQHRSGALWVVNSEGLARLGLAGTEPPHTPPPGVEHNTHGRPTGRLWRADAWLRAQLPPTAPPDLAGVGTALAALGITAVTDATPDLDATALRALAGSAGAGAVPQRIHLLGVPLGADAPPGTTAGPYKIVLADSDLPALDELVDRIRTVHAVGRAIAAHCVTREALVLLLVARTAAGALPGDRVEHAAIVPPELIGELAGLRVITQPGFLAHRGDDYLAQVPASDLDDLYRCASLIAAGVPLALSSDAPYGPLDPWTVMRAAVDRRTPAGAVAGPAERMSAAAALAAYLAPPHDPGGASRRIAVRGVADMVLLDRSLGDMLAAPSADAVVATVVGGRVVHHRG